MAQKQLKWYKLFEDWEEARKKVPLNSTKKVRIGSKKICLAHTKEGFFVVDDECTHMRASLTSGHLNDFNEVICPWHDYRFCLKTGEEKSGKNARPLLTHRIEEKNDSIQLGLYKDEVPPKKDEFSY
ncbi:Rieske 2Fe-2S domain-containing protein [uncultured Microscilla sp.]|uniref:Rieske (2Fe-2S) protein n=1 Tax=uncultured Microscilla sp. TaxID=432653 RepID=UPI00262A92A9|nr:Rieske 2Fe-2S domain-containing protein [uncultured Microscilla sp.]